MTCFFDAAHGPGSQEITWSPQWGAPRPVLACPACAQRWADHLRGGGYPQQGHPQQGYPQRGHGAGSMVAAGAAGFAGGTLVNEMFDHDEVAEHVDAVDVVDEVDVIDVVEVVDDEAEVVEEDYGDNGGDW